MIILESTASWLASLLHANKWRFASFNYTDIEFAEKGAWNELYVWAKALCGGSITFPSFKVMVGRLEKTKAELSRNKKRDELERLLLQPFCVQQEYIQAYSSEEAGISEVEKAIEKRK